MTKWFKFAGIFIGVALIVAALAAVVWAQGPRNGDRACDGCDTAVGDGLQRGRRYNQESDTSQQGRGPFANGEPPCDEFVDEDGDGVCDLCGAAAGDGLRHGWRYNQESDAPQQGRGRFANGETPCDEFVDEDGDGVCDDCGAAEGDGLQRGRQFNQDENERGPYSGTGGRMGGGRMRTP